MNKETLVLKLVAYALLEIRIASHEGNSRLAFEIADVFHNVPYQIERIKIGDGNYQEIINWLEMRCEQKGMTSWLKNAIAGIS
ncbi:MAG: hypothetical protein NTZ64_09830 [Polaromonas sp.]|nr:hypothetical protein [Polaromonas sp.]